MYTSAEPTPETSMEIVADIAEQMGESVNGVRMILTKAGVYVRKHQQLEVHLTVTVVEEFLLQTHRIL